MNPQLLIADDYLPMIERVSLLVSDKFDVVGHVVDGASLVEAAERLEPDVIVTDISMPGLDGLEAVRRLKANRVCNAAIVILTMRQDESLIQRAFALGALAYVLKARADEDLIPAIHEALEGRRFQSNMPHG